MKITLMKFGGNSFKDNETTLRVISIIIDKIKHKELPVIVVSAMGRKGNPYSTDELLKLSDYHPVNDPDLDLLQSSGELISAALLSLRLKSKGLKSRALATSEIGIFTNNNFQKARVKTVNTSKILSLINREIIPVIPGFQGVTELLETTTLGRGGSDTTATVLAKALELDSIEIYTDVDGIFSADPMIVKTASLLTDLDFDEAFEFAAHGAKVIHPRAAEIAKDNNISVKIKSLDENGKETLIHDIKNDKPITGIAMKDNIIHVTINSKVPHKLQEDLSVFDILANNQISVDYISVSGFSISFIINRLDSTKTKTILEEHDFEIELHDDKSMITIIGAGMTGIPGVMGRIVNALQKSNICIYQTTDSHTSISCLLKSVDSQEAICILHSEFSL